MSMYNYVPQKVKNAKLIWMKAIFRRGIQRISLDSSLISNHTNIH